MDYHVYARDGISYLALTDRGTALRVVYSFLQSVANSFTAMYQGRAKTAGAYGMKDYTKQLKKEIDKANDPSSDNISNVQNKLDGVKGKMTENIDQIMANHEKVENLVDKSDNLLVTSNQFNKSAGDLKCQMLKQKWKLIAILLIIFIIIIIIIVVSVS